MKRSSKPKFDNILLKRWLLKVGPVRRKILLTKFRADLVRRGLSKLAWRKGLLQLSSRPFVSLIRDTATTKPTERNDCMKGPRSKKKECRRQRDSNNNENDLVNEEFSPTASSSYLNREHVKKERQDTDKKPGHCYSEYSTSGTASMSDNLTKIVKVEKSGRRRSSGSQKSKDQDRPNKKKKCRLPKEGVNPNNINWRLINVEMEDPLKSRGLRFLQLRQIERKKKKDRLYVKFLEIFGEGMDAPECNKNKSPPSTKTKDTSEERIPEMPIRCKDSTENQRTNEDSDRNPPTFPNGRKKRRRDNHSVDNRKKSKSAEIFDAFKNSLTSDNASMKPGGDTTVSKEEINSLQDDTLMTNWTTATDPLTGDPVTLKHHSVTVDQESDTDTRSTIFTIIKTAETDKKRDSSLGDDCKRGEQTEEEPLNLGLEMENDQESCATIDASQTLVDTVSATRQQSVIVKLDKGRDEPLEANFIKSDSMPQSESIKSQEMDLTGQEAKARESTSPDDGIFTIKDAMENTILQILNLPNTTRNLKNDLVDQDKPAPSQSQQCQWASPSLPDQQPPNIDSSIRSPDVLDNDPNPSSTTDTELNISFDSGLLCISNRLLGALDNIYLALHCRRRVQERVETASMLAIKQNRQKEKLRAQYELESKLITFREEIRYLLEKLDTWDRVLRFVAQGLDHRTPASVKRFSAAEIEAAMLDAEVKPPLSIGDIEPLAVPQLNLVGRVLCTIDLTQDSKGDDSTIDLCDSSTDPPRSQNHPIITPRFDPIDIDANDFGTHDLNANGIQLPLPSIAEVKTISPQQFETIGDRSESSPVKNDDPCYLCSRVSFVACGRCAKATYCSKDCQLVHWEQSHHSTCVPLKGIIHYNT